MNVCERSSQEIGGITFVNVMGKQYVEFNFVKIVNVSLTVVGKLYIEANFVNICECSR